MAPKATTGKGRKRPPPSDAEAIQGSQKALRIDQQQDVSTSHKLDQPEQRTRPTRTTAGRGGQVQQLERTFERIRPDLNTKQKNNTNRFPSETAENNFAPPNAPTILRPTSEAPLSQSSVPQFQQNTPGSCFGFSSSSDAHHLRQGANQQAIGQSMGQHGALQQSAGPGMDQHGAFQQSTGTRAGQGMDQHGAFQQSTGTRAGQGMDQHGACQQSAGPGMDQHGALQQSAGTGQVMEQHGAPQHSTGQGNAGQPAHQSGITRQERSQPTGAQQHGALYNVQPGIQYNPPGLYTRMSVHPSAQKGIQDSQNTHFDGMYAIDLNEPQASNRYPTDFAFSEARIPNLLPNAPEYMGSHFNGNDNDNDDFEFGLAQKNQTLNTRNDDHHEDSSDAGEEHGGHKSDSEVADGDQASGHNQQPEEQGFVVDEISEDEEEARARAFLRNQNNFENNVEEDSTLQDIRNNNTPMNGLSDGDDVLVTHRQTNRAQKAPNPRHLHTHRTTMTGKKQLFLSDDESEDNISDSPPPPPAKQPRKTRTRGVEIKPSSLGYYDDQWRAILREAQNEWRCESVLKLPDPFPSATCDLGSAKNVLENVVARHLNAGAVLRHSYEITRNMQLCVFNILSSWRGTLKKLAMPVVMREYQKQIHSQEDPNEIIDNQEGACDLIRKNVKALLEKHSFHFGPRDAQGRSSNFGHSAIGSVIKACFYYSSHGNNTIKSLAELFPDQFSERVHDNIVALSLCLIKSCPEAYLANPLNPQAGGSAEEFAGKAWKPVFHQYLSTIGVLRKNHYHSIKYETDCVKWAQSGISELLADNRKGDVEQVQLSLD